MSDNPNPPKERSLLEQAELQSKAEKMAWANLLRRHADTLAQSRGLRLEELPGHEENFSNEVRRCLATLNGNKLFGVKVYLPFCVVMEQEATTAEDATTKATEFMRDIIRNGSLSEALSEMPKNYGLPPMEPDTSDSVLACCVWDTAKEDETDGSADLPDPRWWVRKAGSDKLVEEPAAYDYTKGDFVWAPAVEEKKDGPAGTGA